jgi:hypothetical protein
MKKYNVIKEFFKLSEQKHYNVDDTIELTKEEFEAMKEYVVEVKEKAKK